MVLLLPVFMMNWDTLVGRRNSMGGKSRKTGSISKALIDRLKAGNKITSDNKPKKGKGTEKKSGLLD